MTKIIIAVVAVLAVGGGVYYIVNMTSDSGDTPEVSENTQVQEERVQQEDSFAASGSGSLASLLTLGRNISCDFSYTPDEGGTSEGTVYFSGERMRGDFTMSDSSGTYDMSIIHTEEQVYTWGSGPEGEMAMTFKTPEENGNAMEATDTKDGQPLAMDEEVNYECDAWRVDDSKFTPPSDIEFTDFSANMQQMQ